MDITTFANQLFAKGIELALKKQSGVLYLWPPKSKQRLTADERAFLVEYTDDLKRFVRSGLQPKLPDEPATLTSPPEKGITPGNTFTEPNCIYCRRPCVGPSHPLFGIFHYFAPSEIRDKEATKVMLHQMPFGSPL